MTDSEVQTEIVTEYFEDILYKYEREAKKSNTDFTHIQCIEAIKHTQEVYPLVNVFDLIPILIRCFYNYDILKKVVKEYPEWTPNTKSQYYFSESTSFIEQICMTDDMKALEVAKELGCDFTEYNYANDIEDPLNKKKLILNFAELAIFGRGISYTDVNNWEYITNKLVEYGSRKPRLSIMIAMCGEHHEELLRSVKDVDNFYENEE